MKAENTTTRSARARASVGIGGLRKGIGPGDTLGGVDSAIGRRQEAIRAFYRAEVDLLRTVGDDYVTVRRAGGLVLN